MSQKRQIQQAQIYQPPADQEAEQSVLGAILVRPATLDAVADLLTPADFYREAHGRIFQAILDLYGKNEPVDLVTVCALLRNRKQIEGVGGDVFLAGLSEQVGFATNALYYAVIVKNKATLRRTLDTCQEIAGACLAPVENVGEFLDAAEQKIFEVTHGRPDSQIQSVGELGQADYERMEAAHDAGIETHGLFTGFYDLDRITSGFYPGDVTIVAARPSMGKTALAVNIAWHTGHQLKEPAAFFSLEMSKEQMIRRLVSSAGEIDGDRLKRSRLSPDEWSRRKKIQGALDKAPIYVDDKRNLSAMELRARCRRIKARFGLSLVVVDYLQLMAENPRAQSRHVAISQNSRAIKNLAGELGVHVLLLCQVSREIEKDKRKEYRLADLKESGDIEQDADNVIFIWRPQEETEADLQIKKQRNGPLGLVKLAFRAMYCKFDNFAE